MLTITATNHRRGHEKRGGRAPGVGNKIDRDVRAMVLEALHNRGGWRYLAHQADQNPVAFMSLVGRCMPTKVEAEGASHLHLHLTAAQAIVAAAQSAPRLEATPAPVTIEGDMPTE